MGHLVTRFIIIKLGDKFCLYHIFYMQQNDCTCDVSPVVALGVVQDLWGIKQRAGKSLSGTLLESYTVDGGVGRN